MLLGGIAMASLEPDSYTTDTFFALECETLWANSWVAVCRAEDVERPGEFFSTIVGGDPVVVVRGKDGELRSFGNVCPHRNTTIMEGSGSTHALQCPYHLWTFRLDGTLASAPDMSQTDGFEPDEVCLPSVAVETWNSWVFVNLDNTAEPLESQIGGLSERVAPHDLGSLRRAGNVRFEQPWNWKITVENFSESYHHAAVHPQTLQVTYPGQKSWVEDSHGEPWIWLDHVSVDEGVEPFAVGVTFPSHLFSTVRGLGMLWFRVEALSANETILDIELFLPPELCKDEQLVAGLLQMVEEINDEDTSINERVAAGLNSRWAVQGPTSHLERGVDELRTWISERVATAL